MKIAMVIIAATIALTGFFAGYIAAKNNDKNNLN